MRFRKFLRVLGSYAGIAFGAAVAAVGINIFLFPYKIAPGGIAGLATVLYYVFNSFMPLGVLILLLNLPLFIWGIIKLKWKFMIRTLYATVVMSVIIDLTASFLGNVGSNYLMPGETDLILFAFFGGLIIGIGLGIIFRLHATTGGTDLIAELVRRSGVNLTMGQALMIFDAMIVILAGVYFQSFMLALYAMIAVLVTSKVVDSILEGFNFSKGLFIISSKHTEISTRIMHDLGRGLTGFQGTGKYTGDAKEILFCVARAKFIPDIKTIVKEIDPDAFVVVTNVHEVLGEGFRGFDNQNS
ncbi:MAG: YitT family protein [Clostridia bacterium]|nr:YitT family protein [Clostridia bacterium]MBN2882644.1 YitT family protein [Clostridia bacterium]